MDARALTQAGFYICKLSDGTDVLETRIDVLIRKKHESLHDIMVIHQVERGVGAGDKACKAKEYYSAEQLKGFDDIATEYEEYYREVARLDAEVYLQMRTKLLGAPDAA